MLQFHHKLHTPSYTFTGIHCWTHMYNQKYRGFHPRGCLSLLATTRHKFSCSANSETLLNFVQCIEPTHQPPSTISYYVNNGTLLNFVQRIEPTHQPPRMVCDDTMHLHHKCDASMHILCIMPLHVTSLSHM